MEWGNTSVLLSARIVRLLFPYIDHLHYLDNLMVNYVEAPILTVVVV